MQLAKRVDGRLTRIEAGEVNFMEAYEIIVAGLGTAGAVAAITAAGKGLKVLGIERMNCMGGTSTAGAVNGYYFGSTGGLYETLDERAREFEGKVYTRTRSGAFNVEAKKYVLEQEAIKLGADLRFEATVTGVYLEGNRVAGIEWIGPGGIRNASCKVLIDCTGDGVVCNLAGCSTRRGRELDGRTQPFTSAKVYIEDNRVNWRNFDSGCTNQTDGEELSRALIFAHSQHLEEAYTGEKRMLYLAPLLGIREGWLVEGEETVRFKDFFKDRLTDKPVFYAFADIDKHGRDHAFESEDLQDWFVGSNLGAVNVSVPIPLGAMIPKGFEGILAAGRCLSVDHDMSTCVRMNRDMQKSGEAAAMAACLAVKKGVSLKEVPYEELSLLLKETGCLDEKNNAGYQFAYLVDRSMSRNIEWLTDRSLIRQGLSSDRPGVAIWSCRRLGEEIRESLLQWIQDEDEKLKKNSAFALALLGDKASQPVLLQMVKERDPFVLRDCRKNNQIRGYMAIYLLGRLRSTECVDELIDIITGPEEFNRSLYHDRSLVDSYVPEKFNEVYFQFFSHSVMALLKIGDSHKPLRKKIAVALKNAVDNKNYIRRITQKKPGTYEYSVAENIKAVICNALKRWLSESGDS